MTAATSAPRTSALRLPTCRVSVSSWSACPAPPDEAPGVTRLSGVSDAQLRWLYLNAAALVAVAHEDFGLTPVEAQAFGLPSVLLRSGGYLDSGVEDVTTVYIDDFSVQSVQDGIATFRSRSWDRDVITKYGQRYSFQSFANRMDDAVDRVLFGWSNDEFADDFATSQAS